MRRTTVLASLLLACTLGLAACGDDGGDTAADPASDSSTDGDESMDGDAAREAKAAKALADDFFDADDEDLAVTPTESACFGADVIEAVGVDAFVEAGILTEDLEIADDTDAAVLGRPDAEKSAAALVGCAGDTLRGPLQQTLLAQAPADTPAETRTCLEDAVDDAFLEELFAAVFSGEQQAAEGPVGRTIEKCVGEAS